MKQKLGIVVGLGLLVSCAASRVMAPPVGTLPQMQQKVPGITYEEVMQGYNIFKTKCSGCHRLYDPSSRDAASWQHILTKMIPKAKITDPAEKKLVTDYIMANAK